MGFVDWGFGSEGAWGVHFHALFVEQSGRFACTSLWCGGAVLGVWCGHGVVVVWWWCGGVVCRSVAQVKIACEIMKTLSWVQCPDRVLK